MRAMILAAGRGERLRPLTDTCPKPLIKVGGKPLILWHIEKLKAQGITRFVVNSAHLSELIVEYLGDGQFFYACKRLIDERNVLSTVGVNIPDEEKVLVWPLPDDEIKYGDRDSEIWE